MKGIEKKHIEGKTVSSSDEPTSASPGEPTSASPATIMDMVLCTVSNAMTKGGNYGAAFAWIVLGKRNYVLCGDFMRDW